MGRTVVRGEAMRPYRGKRIDNGKMICGQGCQVGDRFWIAPSPEIIEPDDMTETHCSVWGFVEVVPESVGQPTGLFDKNGKEVYE